MLYKAVQSGSQEVAGPSCTGKRGDDASAQTARGPRIRNEPESCIDYLLEISINTRISKQEAFQEDHSKTVEAVPVAHPLVCRKLLQDRDDPLNLRFLQFRVEWDMGD